MEKGSERVEQDTEKEFRNGEQSQDNTEEAVKVALVEEHNDTPCLMVIEEGTPLASHSDSVTLQTDSLQKTDHELQNGPHLSPPLAGLDSNKELVNPKEAAIFDSRLVEDEAKRPTEPCDKNEMELDKASEGLDNQAVKENGNSIDEAMSADNVTTMDLDPSKPDMLVPDALIEKDQKSDGKEIGIATQEAKPAKDIKCEVVDSQVAADAIQAEQKDESAALKIKSGDSDSVSVRHDDSKPSIPCFASSDVKSEGGVGLNNGVHKLDSDPLISDGTMNSKRFFLLGDMSEGNDSGTDEDQSAFMKELEGFFRARNLEFKPPKFYGEGLNCLKLWRAVIRLGGYDKVTARKLWRQVGESFRPPKTCTTVSWTFRGFYEKALLDYERHKVNGGELQIPISSHSEPMNIDGQASGSGRARRDSAARAMQGWQSQRLPGNSDDKCPGLQQKRDKQMGTPAGLLKRKRPMATEHDAKVAPTRVSKPLVDVTVVDVGPPAEWVKVNVQRTKDCFEVYALVPGLLREEVRVQSDPAGHLVITGEPKNPDNLWGASPFKKIVRLPARIDAHHTSAVVTLNGQLFVRVPLERSDQDPL